MQKKLPIYSVLGARANDLKTNGALQGRGEQRESGTGSPVIPTTWVALNSGKGLLTVGVRKYLPQKQENSLTHQLFELKWTTKQEGCVLVPCVGKDKGTPLSSVPLCDNANGWYLL